ncbi:MAG: winged helix-turn-helix domain-containing protein [Pseudomonadota bacterium]
MTKQSALVQGKRWSPTSREQPVRRTSFEIAGQSYDPKSRSLKRGSDEFRLSPRAARLIEVLAHSPMEVVGRDALMDQIWPDVTVGEESLTQVIAELRRALGDSARSPRFIETVAKAGYRLLVEPRICRQVVSARHLSECECPGDPTAPDDQPFATSIVVVPFDVVAGGRTADVLANGLSRDVATNLARSRWLFVSARASAAALSSEHAEPPQIARRLGVRYALWGSVIVSDGRLRVMVSLCDSQSGAVLWAERYDRAMGDLFELLDDVGLEVARTVEAEISQHLRHVARVTPVETLDAWGLYHRAAKYRFATTAQDIDEVDRLLGVAAQMAPHSARIRAASALVELRRHAYLAPRGSVEALERASEIAQAAVTLDSCEAEAMVVLGRTLGMFGQSCGALDWLRRAVHANPCSFDARTFLALSLLIAGQRREALEHVGMAERLSPFDPIAYTVHATKAQAMALAGDSDAALDYSERAVHHPNANVQISAVAAWCASAAGKLELARNHASRLLRARPGFVADDFFSWFHFTASDRETITRALRHAGL